MGDWRLPPHVHVERRPVRTAPSLEGALFHRLALLRGSLVVRRPNGLLVAAWGCGGHLPPGWGKRR
jgi:hypothetical protein